jgi:molybdopterin converting factor small subunit
MRVTVHYFATLRDLKGRAEERPDLPDGITVAGAYAHLGLPADLPVAFAVNLQRVPAGTRLQEGDEVAFLPPLGGG